MNRAEILAMIEKMFASGAVKQDNHRCIYENDDIMVEHSFMSSGWLSCGFGRPHVGNGQIIRTETGATLLKD